MGAIRLDRPQGAESRVVGMGSIGTEVARVASEFGMRTVGVKRTVTGVDAAALHLDALYGSKNCTRRSAVRSTSYCRFLTRPTRRE